MLDFLMSNVKLLTSTWATAIDRVFLEFLSRVGTRVAAVFCLKTTATTGQIQHQKLNLRFLSFLQHFQYLCLTVSRQLHEV